MMEADLHKQHAKRSGCYSILNRVRDQQIMIPLKNIDYQLQIVNSLLLLQLTQTYYNPTDKYLQVQYAFPLRPQSSIYKFKAKFGNVQIEGIIKQKQQAKIQYEEAKKQGRQAVIGTIDESNKDIMKLKIGNIAPNSQFSVQISFIQELSIVNNTFYTFTVPSTISPRYMDKIFPPHRQKLAKNDIQSSKFKWTFKIQLKTHQKVNFFDSSTHNITLLSQNQQSSQSILVMEQAQTPNKDFTFFYTTEDFHKPSYVLGKTDTSSTIMLSFIPKFCELNINDAYRAATKNQQYETNIQSVKGQYIFLLDRSGSMRGHRIQKALEALVIFLKSLPEDSYFNVVSFGNKFQKLFQKSQRNNSDYLQQALKQIKTMSANFGGTNIYNPLVDIFSNQRINGYPKHIFLLTDGCVSNTQHIIKLIEKQIKYSRVHSIGIGNGISPALIEGSAKAGKGKYVMISDQQKPSKKIIGLLQSTLTPLITDLKLTIDNKNIQSIVPNPQSVPYILKDDVANFYVNFDRPIEQKVKFNFEYKDSVSGLPYSSEVEIDPQSENYPFVNKMAHLKVLRSLEEAAQNGILIEDQMFFAKVKDYKSVAIQYSVKHQILSKYTAFLCLGKQLVDGKYQQFISKSTQNIKVQQILPIQNERNLIPPPMRAARHPAPQMMMDRCVKAKSKSNNINLQQQQQIRPQKNYQLKKPSSGNFKTLQIASSLNMAKSDRECWGRQETMNDHFNDNIVPEIKQVKKLNHNKKKYRKQSQKQSMQQQSLTSFKSDQMRRRCKKFASQSISTNKNIKTIDSIIEQQSPNGGWSNKQLIDQLAADAQRIHNLATKFGLLLVITQLVVNWIHKNYNDSIEYKLILKKAESFIKKQCVKNNVTEEDLADIICL